MSFSGRATVSRNARWKCRHCLGLGGSPLPQCSWYVNDLLTEDYYCVSVPNRHSTPCPPFRFWTNLDKTKTKTKEKKREWKQRFVALAVASGWIKDKNSLNWHMIVPYGKSSIREGATDLRSARFQQRTFNRWLDFVSNGINLSVDLYLKNNLYQKPFFPSKSIAFNKSLRLISVHACLEPEVFFNSTGSAFPATRWTDSCKVTADEF